MKIRIAGIILISLLISCNGSNEDKKKSKIVLKTTSLSFADGFDIEYHKDYKLITIYNPWQGAQEVDYKYLLVNRKADVPDIKADLIIKTPIKRVICLSTTHIGFIDVLNETNSVMGVSGKDYVNNNNIRERIDNKEVVDVGFDNSLNYELIAGLNPDLVITYGVGSQVAGYNQKLNDLGIKTIICAEYLEDHPLGKLEWIKFLAAFYNKDNEANEYFNKIESEYKQLLSLTDTISKKPYVLFGLPWKDVWYVPGGKSYLAKLVDDAGGTYIWDDNESRESTPYDIESMFVLASKANVWLNTGSVNRKSDILKSDSRFEKFKPFDESVIFNNNNRTNIYGGNDYWESGLVEPHIVLKDMIKMFHPDLLKDHSLVYYKAIE
jgi:iron complex transport system substrate-binding protein